MCLLFMYYAYVSFAVTFGMTNSLSYYFTDAVTEVFVNERADLSFKEIDGIDDWYRVST